VVSHPDPLATVATQQMTLLSYEIYYIQMPSLYLIIHYVNRKIERLANHAAVKEIQILTISKATF